MGILAWIILGLVAGFIGSKLVNKTGEGLIMDIVLGVVGAVVGRRLHLAGEAGPGLLLPLERRLGILGRRIL